MTTGGQIIIPYGETPDTPPVGKVVIYARDDNYVYFMADDGLENKLPSASGISHGTLLHLLDDTHLQYHTDARGDVRYYTQAQVDAISGSLQDAVDGVTILGEDHSILSNLDYSSSGHVGFQPTGDYSTNTALTVVSGSLSEEIDGDIVTHTSNVNAHHAQDHLVDSHSDTSATGPELDELTGGGTTTLHDHGSMYYTEVEVTAISGNIVSQIITDHLELSGLDYASAGHTGFQPADNYLTDVEFSTYSGTLQDDIDTHLHDGRYYTEGEVDTISGSITAKIPSDFYSTSDIDTLCVGLSTKIATASGTLQIQLDSTTTDHGELMGLTDDDHVQYTLSDGSRNITGNQMFEDGAVISGDLVVEGTTFNVEVEEVLIKDNLLVINNGEVGNGVTTGSAGIEVDRGSAINYRFIFDETHDNFQVGISGLEQAVSTREDSPISNYIPYWNDTTYRWETVSGIDYRSVSVDGHVHDDRYFTESEITTMSGNIVSKIPIDVSSGVVTNYENITALSGVVSVNTVGIENNALDIATNSGNIVTNTTVIDLIELDMISYLETINTNTSGIEVNTLDIENISTVVEANAKLITSVSGVVTTNTISIETNTPIIGLNTAKVTNAVHTGEVTGSGILIVADNVVDEANLKLDSEPINGHVLVADSSKSGGMVWEVNSTAGIAWELMSTTTSGVKNTGYLIDASLGDIGLILPETPSEGDTMGTCDYTDSATTNTITLYRSGSNIESSADDLTIDIDGSGFILVYTDVIVGWKIVSEVGAGTIATNSYGISWNESLDTYTRTGSLVTQPTSQTLADAMLPIQASMRRCILNDAGEVQYYLGATDSTKREDGVLASDLTGTDGQVMVQIPKFYYKYSYSGTTHTWEISLLPQFGFSIHPAFNKNGEVVDYRYMGAYEGIGWDASVAAYIDSTNVAATGWSGTVIDLAYDILSSVSGKCPVTDETRAEFRAIAANRGPGWRQLDFDLASTIQLLYLVEYADWNSQAMIGAGRTELSGGSWTKDSYIGVTGKSNGDGNGTNSVGGNTNDAYMTYRGIENFFGNVWKWVDGINIGGASSPADDNKVHVSNTDTDFDDDTWANYTDLGVTLANANGYQKFLEQQARGFLPASVGGTGVGSSTYITDYYYQATGWRVAMRGGVVYYGAAAGVAEWSLGSASSDAYAMIGSRLCF